MVCCLKCVPTKLSFRCTFEHSHSFHVFRMEILSKITACISELILHCITQKTGIKEIQLSTLHCFSYNGFTIGHVWKYRTLHSRNDENGSCLSKAFQNHHHNPYPRYHNKLNKFWISFSCIYIVCNTFSCILVYCM